MKIENIEEFRLTKQSELDALKSQEERNKLGQFATPSALARDILTYAKNCIEPNSNIEFLDPALGTGAFYSALKSVFDTDKIKTSFAFEIDPHYGNPAQELWGKHGLDLRHGDFTKAEPEPRFNLIICNPPYVRHHHLSSEYKSHLNKKSLDASNHKLSGLAGLYAHFLLQAHAWMAPGAIAGWLIPSEFMDVNYGKVIKDYLTTEVSLLKIHRFSPDDVQFTDALVSSAIVWIKNELPPTNHQVTFTFGGSLLSPKIERKISITELALEKKWTRFPKYDVRETLDVKICKISDLFNIRRGLATGNNKFFILTEKQVRDKNLPYRFLKPILPSPRYVKTNEISSDLEGIPNNVNRLFLLDPRMDENEIEENYPSVMDYLTEGRLAGVHEGYLCRNRKRWYDQEQKNPAPIVCTYMGRSKEKESRPFRFIKNNSIAVVANTYLAMYPKENLQEIINDDPSVIDKICQQLNNITEDVLLGEGRIYGGGLSKLEPKELGNIPVDIQI